MVFTRTGGRSWNAVGVLKCHCVRDRMSNAARHLCQFGKARNLCIPAGCAYDEKVRAQKGECVRGVRLPRPGCPPCSPRFRRPNSRFRHNANCPKLHDKVGQVGEK